MCEILVLRSLDYTCASLSFRPLLCTHIMADKTGESSAWAMRKPIKRHTTYGTVKGDRVSL